ncbi:hypothetical protein [Pseudonocardia halophobica]|uniref:hypothetical protein n=1 Tax=Pseudonocardia halophobica TaxID=29401 RepID=UPI00068F296E|nr:hypothetical protein [Pseudonocardia halophobica]
MVEDEGDWASELAAQIGQRVLHFRQWHKPKLSVQVVADRCAAAGHPLDRSVIAKIEKGQRRTVTVADILALAAALEVTPVALIFPLGEQEEFQVLPNRRVTTWRAVQYFIGDSNSVDWRGDISLRERGQLVKAEPAEWEKRSGTWLIAAWRRHDEYAEQWESATQTALRIIREVEEAEELPENLAIRLPETADWESAKGRAEDMLLLQQAHIHSLVRAIARLRDEIREAGFKPPRIHDRYLADAVFGYEEDPE